MLTLGMPAGGPPHIVNHPVSPMVYFDHWALRMFSEDVDLASRLTQALNARKGTLAVSWLNFAEFSKVSDQLQRQQAERLLDGMRPNLFCLDVDAVAVERKERAGMVGPQSDMNLAGLFFRAGTSPVVSFTADGIFQVVYDQRLSGGHERLAAQVQEGLTRLQGSPNNPFQGSAKTAAMTGPTRAVLDMLIETLTSDHAKEITPNDAIDLLHVTVPIVHCDIVLLDGPWEDLVGRVRRQLGKVVPSIRLAETFSPRRGGVGRFLDWLEAG